MGMPITYVVDQTARRSTNHTVSIDFLLVCLKVPDAVEQLELPSSFSAKSFAIRLSSQADPNRNGEDSEWRGGKLGDYASIRLSL